MEHRGQRRYPARVNGTLFIPWFRWEASVFELLFAGEVTLQPFAVLIWLGQVVGLSTAVQFARTHERSVPQTLQSQQHVLPRRVRLEEGASPSDSPARVGDATSFGRAPNGRTTPKR